MSHLLRVALPDVPGSLGMVAAALGSAGVNIEAIEIVEHAGGGRAVDDVFISLSPGVLPDEAVSAVMRLEGVEVLWVARYPVAGNLNLDLEAVELIAQSPRDAVKTLTRVVPETFRSDWAFVLTGTPGGVRVVASTQGAPEPVAECDEWLPMTTARRLDTPESWGPALLGAAPIGGPDTVVVFGRHGGPPVLDSELARVAHLAALTFSIEQSVGQSRTHEV
jgi:hypothetical protein